MDFRVSSGDLPCFRSLKYSARYPSPITSQSVKSATMIVIVFMFDLFSGFLKNQAAKFDIFTICLIYLHSVCGSIIERIS